MTDGEVTSVKQMPLLAANKWDCEAGYYKKPPCITSTFF